MSRWLWEWKKELVTQLCPTLCDPMDGSPPDSSVHGIFQARILEWVAISFSRRSSQPRDQTWSLSLQADSLRTKWRGKPFTLMMSLYLNSHPYTLLSKIPLITSKLSTSMGETAPLTVEQVKLLESSVLHWTQIWKRPWCWERLRAGRKGRGRGQDGWMASPTQWTWVWANSRR